MRIALIISAFPSPEHPYIGEWIQEMLRQGIDIQIIAEDLNLLSLRNPDDEIVLRHAGQFNRLQNPARSLFQNAGKLVKIITKPGKLWNLAKTLARKPIKRSSKLLKFYEYLPWVAEHFDLIHFNAPQIAVRRFELTAILDAPMLVSFRGQDFSFDALRFQNLLNQADHLHFISNHLLELAKEHGYTGGKHTLIPPLVDLDVYCPLIRTENRMKTDPWVLFTAARFSWTKGWEFVLRAIALIVQQGWDVHYYIAGQGDFKDALLYTIHELDLHDRVHLVGWLSPKDIAAWMQRSDLYLLASVEEGFNNSVLQAQSCGLPVVCSDAGGLPENIEEGVTGLLFHRRDAWDMAEKIELLLSDSDLRIRLGQAGRQRAESCFSLQSGVDAFASLYKYVAGSRSA